MSLLSRLFADRKGELEEEIQAHLRMAAEDRRERGDSAEEARTAALREFGNIPLVEDVTREMWGWVWLERLVEDLKYALRQLRKSPGFTFAVIGTLALGLGATAAMFTVVDRVLLRPLPYEDPGRLVEIQEAGKGGAIPYGAPALDIEQWQERSRTLEGTAYYTPNIDLGHRSFLEGTTGAATQVNAPNISANLFEILGVHPAMGRAFEARRDNGSAQPGDARSIILSDAVWRTLYGGDAKILGKTVKLNGESCTVVGVMPRGFTFPLGGESSAVWRPIVLGDADAVRSKHGPHYQVIARLKRGVGLRDAEAELKVIQADVARAYTDADEREQVTSIKLHGYGDS